KSINSYQHAAKFFGDEGQLIKAIGAVKVILEIDPKNEDAQKQLQEMNERRFGKVTLESAGLKSAKGIGAGARATSAMELEEASSAAAAVSSAVIATPPPSRPPPPEEESLELDDGKPSKAIAPRGGPVIKPKPAPAMKKDETGAFDLSDEGGDIDLDLGIPSEAPKAGTIAPPPPSEVELD